MTRPGTTVHASAVLIGARAALIRGPSGSGKSRLAVALLTMGRSDGLFTRLVADDRAHLQASHGRLIVRPAETLKGLLEIYGLGIRRVEFEPAAVVGMVVDLAADDAVRLLEPEQQVTELGGVAVARLAVAPGNDPLPLVLAIAQDWRRP
jgi:HPr kinase/phosphorylase